MRRVLIVFMSLLLFVGCNNKEGLKGQSTAVDKSENISSTSNSNQKDIVDKKNENGIVTIQDIANWNHPTKSVFESYGFKIQKVKLLKNNQYPIFYIDGTQKKDIYGYSFINKIAEKNSYWDFKIVSNEKYNEIYCDQKQKIVLKSVNDKSITDYTKNDFFRFNGKWYDQSFIKSENGINSIELEFKDNGKDADAYLVSDTPLTGRAEIRTIIHFDDKGYGKFNFDDKYGNAGTGDLNIVDDGFYVETKLTKIKNKEKGFIGHGSYVREYGFVNIKKSYEYLVNKLGIIDNNKGMYVPKTDDDVYLDYEGKDEKSRYIFGLRRCSDTVIVCWYHINPISLEYETEN